MVWSIWDKFLFILSTAICTLFNDNLTNLPHKNSQPEVTNFLKDRGGNKGPTRQQNNEHPNVPVVEGFSDQPNQEEVFYPGDKILSGNFSAVGVGMSSLEL